MPAAVARGLALQLLAAVSDVYAWAGEHATSASARTLIATSGPPRLEAFFVDASGRLTIDRISWSRRGMAADIFEIGAALHALLTCGFDPSQRLARLGLLRVDVDRALEEIVARACHENPLARFDSFARFASVLARSGACASELSVAAWLSARNSAQQSSWGNGTMILSAPPSFMIASPSRPPLKPSVERRQTRPWRVALSAFGGLAVGVVCASAYYLLST